MDVRIGIYIISILISIVLPLLILSKKKTTASIFFSGLILAITFWIGSNLLVDYLHDKEQILFWTRAAILGPLILSPTFFNFAQYFNSGVKANINSIIFSYLPLIIFIPFVFSDFNVSNINISESGAVLYDPGIVFYLTAIYAFIYIALGYKLLLKTYHLTSGIVHKQIFLIILGLSASFSITIATTVILPLLGMSEYGYIGPMGTVVFLGAITYTILKHRLFGTRFFIGRFIYGGLLTFIPFIVFYILYFIYNEIFDNLLDINVILFNLVVSAIFVFVFFKAEENIKKFVNRYFLDPGLEFTQARKYLLEKFNKLLKPEDLMKNLSEKLKDVLKIEEISFQVIELSKNNSDVEVKQSYMFSTNSTHLLTEEFIEILFEGDSDLTTQPIFYDDINIKSEIKNYLQLKRIQAIFTIKVDIDTFALLTFFEEDVIKTVGLEIVSFVDELLKDASIALSRALLYQEVQNFSATLQHKIDDATAEIVKQKDEIAEQLRKERDMMDILGHELRTPLSTSRNAISLMDMALQAAKDQPIDKDTLRKYIDKALENMRREIKLLETVLSSTKIENDRLQLEIGDVDCIKIGKDTVETMSVAAQKKFLELKADLPNTPVTCKGDKDRVQEIMYNLVDNAIKYTEKGTITVKLEDLGNEVRFSVIDTGLGIPAEAIPNIGKKFYRVNTYLHNDEKLPVVRPGGTGIGMYVVFGLMKLMKGRVEITSPGVGKGSTFSIYLPK